MRPRKAKWMEFALDKTIEVLSATPAAVRGMLGGLSDEWTSSGGRENWGPYDVVGHLINCDRTNWIPRARVILEQGADLTFPPFDRFSHFEQSAGKQLRQLIDEFDVVRTASIETVRDWDLSDSKLCLKGNHPGFGDVELSQLLATWTVHDLTHIRQIATSMAKRYDAAVGPWKTYLSILK